MKLSFSLPPKSKSKSRVCPISDRNDGVDEGNLKEFVTEFDPSETLTYTKPRYVIPPTENRWRPHKVINNTHLPQQSELEFVAEIPSGDSDKITYGLNLRQNVEDKPSSKPESVEQMLLKSLRKDLDSLPDAPQLEDFESVPVEGFGAALLAGYGWKPGQGIGRNPREDVQIVEYKKWNGNAGFGFNPNQTRVKGTNAKVKETGKSNKPREIGAGKEAGLKGKKMTIKKLGSGNQEECRIVRKRSRETERESKHSGREKKTTWLRSGIRVRIISKDVKGGRLYLQKAVVTDVIGPTTCDIIVDESQKLVQGIDQEFLETALPKRGGPVLVLSGRHKGVYGNLVEKDLDEQTGVVCDADSKEMLDVKLEQVAEYMGDPHDIGY